MNLVRVPLPPHHSTARDRLYATVWEGTLASQPPLTSAILIATIAHDGQLRMCGERYIYHPLRVMNLCRAYDEVMPSADEAFAIVGALHDVVEDTDLTLDDLRRLEFSELVISAVDAISRRVGEIYTAYLQRVKLHEIARYVKLADVQDNWNRLHRIQDQKQRDSLGRRYLKATEFLRS